MNDNVFAAIKQDIERKGIYYGDIVLSLTYHDGRVTSYTITTTERRNCGPKNGDTSSHLNRPRFHE